MKFMWIWLVAIIFVIISGCTSNIIGGGSLTPGTYVNSHNPSSFVTIDADKNFIQELPTDISWGTYKMGGDVITVEGNCREGKGLMFSRFCGDKFIMYYKVSGKDTFCQMTGKDGSASSVCYTLQSS
jgi:hypothetical protein